MHDDAQAKAAATYNAAEVAGADGYVLGVDLAENLPELLRALFSGTGAAQVDVVAEPGMHSLRSPEDWWPMVLGTGYRGTIGQMTDEDQALVKRECLEFIRASAVSSVEANVVYAIATKGF